MADQNGVKSGNSSDIIDMSTPLDEITIPDDAVDLTEDKNGGVYKILKRPGQGESRPSTGDTVTVNYIGTLTDGTQFDSSIDRGETFSFSLGRSQVIKGWDLAVSTMKKGESCRIIVKAAYAYGEGGSPPRIPPRATLIFDIDLISWEGEDISPDHDKTITRSIQKDGQTYEYPNEGATITAHIVGVYDGREFRNGEVQFNLGEATEAGLPEGIDKALKRMRKGERSCIQLKSRWGYGRHGNQQFNIPPNADVDFEVELKDYEKAKEPWAMNDDEKLEEAEKLKQRGTEFFQAGKNKLAAAKYRRITDLLQHFNQLDGAMKEKRNALYLAAHNNLAMVFLKTNETVEAIKHCDKVLEVDPKNVKALYRRGQAYQNQNDLDVAVKCYEKLLEYEPDNKAAQANIAKCKSGITEQTKRQKAVYANMFDKLTKSSNDDDAQSSQPQKEAEPVN